MDIQAASIYCGEANNYFTMEDTAGTIIKMAGITNPEQRSFDHISINQEIIASTTLQLLY